MLNWKKELKQKEQTEERSMKISGKPINKKSKWTLPKERAEPL